MEREKELAASIGRVNFDILIKEVDSGKVPEDVVQRISLQMGVHGVYKEELRKRHDLRLVMCHMLDRWYTTHLYKFKCGVNGLQELKHVLSHTELKYLISAFVDEFQDDETIKNLTQQVQDLLKQI